MQILLPSKILRDKEIQGRKLTDEALSQLVEMLPGVRVFLGGAYGAGAPIGDWIGVVSGVDGYNIVVNAIKEIPAGVASNVDITLRVSDDFVISDVVRVNYVGIASKEAVQWAD